MSINPAYLLECTLYEKCLKEINNEDYFSEFQRVFPQLFNVPFTITSEIEDLDRSRNALVQELDEVSEDTARYNDIEDALWYAYRYEVNAFYEANRPRLDAIIAHYQQFLNKEGAQEELIVKLVRTPRVIGSPPITKVGWWRAIPFS